MEIKLKNTILYKTGPNKMKYLGMHLIEYVPGLYATNRKILMKELKDI